MPPPNIQSCSPNLKVAQRSLDLGAVLRQKQVDGLRRPIAYASRALSPPEQRYAQIEKEALSIFWASERFYDYLIGIWYHTEPDYKPLRVSLLECRGSGYA